MTNTNKLIRFYDGCDGGKTGFTNQAGFCLAATAKRGEMRLISVVIGAESSAARFEGVKSLLNYAFAAFESRKLLEAGAPIGERLAVRGCKQREIEVCAETPLALFCRKGEEPDADVEIRLDGSVKPPFGKGTPVGEAVLYRSGVEVARCRLLAAEAAEKFSWGEAYREIASKWN